MTTRGRVAGSIAAALIAACGAEAPPHESGETPAAGESTPFVWPEGQRDVAVLRVRGRGEIRIALYPELAPETVANFIELADRGFYAGTTFHRVIPGFMIQGGDPNTRDDQPADDGKGGPGYTISDELSAAPHERGVVSMANTGRKNSAGSQFFIVLAPTYDIDGRYTVFGRVIAGMDVVDAIAQVETDAHGRWGPKYRPLENEVVEHVHVERRVPVAAAEGAS